MPKKIVVTCPKCGHQINDGDNTIAVGEDKMWCERCVKKYKPDLYEEIGCCLRDPELKQMLFPDREAETEFDYN